MKVIILAGGKGTRMGNMTERLPKPMVPLGGKPILWHIMKTYAHQGFKDFIVCCDHHAERISEFINNLEEDWDVEVSILKDKTGREVTKAQRIKNVEGTFDDKEFFVSYGDDLCDVNLKGVYDFFKKMNKIATITSVRLRSRFGVLETDPDSLITGFKEKPLLNYWINGGYMVFNRRIFDFLHLGELENEVFEKLVELKEICTFKHMGNWETINTYKDYLNLNNLWATSPFWKIWE